jgi:hypothetical protein
VRERESGEPDDGEIVVRRYTFNSAKYRGLSIHSFKTISDEPLDPLIIRSFRPRIFFSGTFPTRSRSSLPVRGCGSAGPIRYLLFPKRSRVVNRDSPYAYVISKVARLRAGLVALQTPLRQTRWASALGRFEARGESTRAS